MIAIILAGGKGTRLKPFTVSIPKPLLPLGEVPILEIIIRQLAASGIKRIVLTLGHMAPFFTAFIGTGERLGVTIDYCHEEEPLGTAGSILQVPNLPDHFLVMNGDILSTIDYDDLIAFHLHRQAWGTVAVSQRQLKIDFGVVKSCSNGYLDDYQEKPTIPYNVSMGINMLSRQCIEFIPKDRKFDMPDLMLSMKRAGKTVACYETSCYWQDIGMFDDYETASTDYVENPGRFLPGCEQ